MTRESADSALLLQHEKDPQLRASLAAFMAFGVTLSLVALAAVGEFNRHEVQVTLGLVPFVIAGFVVSKWTARIADQGYTRPLVLAFAAVSAISILIREVI